MYSRVPKRNMSGPCGDSLSLVLEYMDARKKAAATHDLDAEDFVPEDWLERANKIWKQHKDKK